MAISAAGTDSSSRQCLGVNLKEVTGAIVSTQRVTLLPRCQQTWAHYGSSVLIQTRSTRLRPTPGSDEGSPSQISLAAKQSEAKVSKNKQINVNVVKIKSFMNVSDETAQSCLFKTVCCNSIDGCVAVC